MDFVTYLFLIGAILVIGALTAYLTSEKNLSSSVSPKGRHVRFNQVLSKDIETTERPYLEFALLGGLLIMISLLLLSGAIPSIPSRATGIISLVPGILGAGILGFSLIKKETTTIQVQVLESTKTRLLEERRSEFVLKLSSPAEIIASRNSVLDGFNACREGMCVGDFFLLSLGHLNENATQFIKKLQEGLGNPFFPVLLEPVEDSLQTNQQNSSTMESLLRVFKDAVTSRGGVIIFNLEYILGQQEEMEKRFTRLVSRPLDMLAKSILMDSRVAEFIRGYFLVPTFGCAENSHDALEKALPRTTSDYDARDVKRVLVVSSVVGNGGGDMVKAQGEMFIDKISEKFPNAEVSITEPLQIDTGEENMVESCIFLALDRYPRLEEWQRSLEEVYA